MPSSVDIIREEGCGGKSCLPQPAVGLARFDNLCGVIHEVVMQHNPPHPAGLRRAVWHRLFEITKPAQHLKALKFIGVGSLRKLCHYTACYRVDAASQMCSNSVSI